VCERRCAKQTVYPGKLRKYCVIDGQATYCILRGYSMLQRLPWGTILALTQAHADQIAALIKKRNALTIPYTGAKVVEHARNYLCRKGDVIGCVEVKKVQW
jgi:hypothetical protein